MKNAKSSKIEESQTPNKNDWNYVAPCGLYCGECKAFLLKECGGCRSEKGISKNYVMHCKIYQCARNKNLKICLECDAFPCKFFDFFKAEKPMDSSWFLDVWSNMKQIREGSLESFLKTKKAWLKRRLRCANKKGIRYCDECKSWPCELLKRPVLVPADLQKFREFMEKI
ncbi:MAG: DUF3795 domain-containing protein [Candidatus Bathyarchaeia archaeon]